jgi:hypothetical protein
MVGFWGLRFFTFLGFIFGLGVEILLRISAAEEEGPRLKPWATRPFLLIAERFKEDLGQ